MNFLEAMATLTDDDLAYVIHAERDTFFQVNRGVVSMREKEGLGEIMPPLQFSDFFSAQWHVSKR